MKSTRGAGAKPDARQKLLAAALDAIREQGYAGTSVEDLCSRAGVTKGAFFHHFKSKEALAVAAANHWSEITGAFFADASYHQLEDPLERFLGYLDFRKSILRGSLPDFTCLAGTLIQEVYGTHSEIRDACADSIQTHASRLVPDIAAAMAIRDIRGDWTAEGLAMHTQAVLQGAFVLAKATGGAEVAVASVDHLRRYVELLFRSSTTVHKED